MAAKKSKQGIHMKNLSLVALTGVIVGTTSPYALAQQNAENLYTHDQAYLYCETLANEDESDNDWSIVLNNCMADQGFGITEPDTSDTSLDESLSEDTYDYDNYMTDQ